MPTMVRVVRMEKETGLEMETKEKRAAGDSLETMKPTAVIVLSFIARCLRLAAACFAR